MAECINNLCRILDRFLIFLRFVRSFACELQFNWKTLSSIFFSAICVSYSRNNICKELCFSLRTQRNRQRFLSSCLIICSVRVVCKLHYVVLAKVSFAYVISRIRNTNRRKIYCTMCFSGIAIHMHNF